MSDQDRGSERVGYGSMAFVEAARDYTAELLNLTAEIALSTDSALDQAVKARRLLDRIEATAIELLQHAAEEREK